ncbi:anthranilate phosphoribosyltransferase [Glaciecola sp. KUL10]|uniref:anthranilate phosphoribosyltransferase n=1 Tax=Glaciecola sp. (strain KUL10) TaxID=2161813 RepID=UPI000D7842A1|nr:anthranilate phosphoribosyltransferase [Glaciecola sp. KUL10]GBL05487.1 anthranilate phosphoribosyltransferase [Glaciecola sp. KUL10]
MSSSIETSALLGQLFDGGALDFKKSKQLFTRVLSGDLSEVETTAALIALKMKTETNDEIAGAAQAMTDSALEFPRPNYEFSDIVGTGGDGHNTINISSAAAVVAASCGIKVAKHGNRSVSSKSGSSDLFNAFGIDLNMSPTVARTCLDHAGLCFLAAPKYHLGMKYVMPIRTALKTRTLFNILGPLANPAKPTHHMLGVYTPALLDIYANILVSLNRNNAFVVHGDGLDELALHGPSQIRHVKDGAIESFTVSPSDFNLKEFSLVDIQGGDPSENKQLIEAVFNGEGADAHTSAIAMNAAALIHLNGKSKDFKEACDIAMQAIALKKPMQVINEAAELSQSQQA